MDLEFNSLDEPSKARVVDSCMLMLRTMTEVFGIEKGESIYNAVVDVCGQDVKGAVLFAMLTGQHGGVTLHNASNVTQYVDLIKCVRNYTGMGLKEAKDACDKARDGKAVRFDVESRDRHKFVHDLQMIRGTVVS